MQKNDSGRVAARNKYNDAPHPPFDFHSVKRIWKSQVLLEDGMLEARGEGKSSKLRSKRTMATMRPVTCPCESGATAQGRPTRLSLNFCSLARFLL